MLKKISLNFNKFKESGYKRRCYQNYFLDLRMIAQVKKLVTSIFRYMEPELLRLQNANIKSMKLMIFYTNSYIRYL